ncbi:hypothetical protein MGYG_02346 [Nannizzia gypsea CBS 118893]|uniref:Uncharacterized protein n=1 Tax=Arthroderma gypseum (strain ATCC MYA-4604 / CBS 118893) TaxID=535722 RepID=E4UR58_ARTGP|nr:hypothetical protein MGYG_02346 [Nannizzia gypsea CBS 118893]EFQ99333.1 hypothetical protein MGYG_02346 [Nannizzia gypsea CBS 118893]
MNLSFAALLISAVSLFAVADALEWNLYRSYSATEYAKTLNMTDNKFRLTYISAYANAEGEARYNAIFEKPEYTPAWRTNYGYNGNELNNTFNDLKNKGFRPVLVEGYNINGERHYTSLWENNTESIEWAERRDMSGKEFNTWVKEHKKKGFRLRHLSGYEYNNEQQFTGVFEKRDSAPWKAYVGLSPWEYRIKSYAAKRSGYYPVQISPYTACGKVWFAAIFEKLGNKKDTPVTVFGLDSSRYKMESDVWESRGYKPTMVDGYLDNGEKFAAIFNKV